MRIRHLLTGGVIASIEINGELRVFTGEEEIVMREINQALRGEN